MSGATVIIVTASLSHNLIVTVSCHDDAYNVHIIPYSSYFKFLLWRNNYLIIDLVRSRPGGPGASGPGPGPRFQLEVADSDASHGPFAQAGSDARPYSALAGPALMVEILTRKPFNLPARPGPYGKRIFWARNEDDDQQIADGLFFVAFVCSDNSQTNPK